MLYSHPPNSVSLDPTLYSNSLHMLELSHKKSRIFASLEVTFSRAERHNEQTIRTILDVSGGAERWNVVK